MPVQVDCPSHVVVQPVPHVEVQSFLLLQSYVTPLAAGAALASGKGPPSPLLALPLPKLHLPPTAHVHVVPEQVQSPEHVAAPSSALLLPPQATVSATPEAMAKRARITIEGCLNMDVLMAGSTRIARTECDSFSAKTSASRANRARDRPGCPRGDFSRMQRLGKCGRRWSAH